MNKKLIIAIFLLLSSKTISAVTTDTGKDQKAPISLTAESDYTCGNIWDKKGILLKQEDKTYKEVYAKNGKFYLCLHFLQFNVKIPYKLQVDKYTIMEVKQFHHALSSLSKVDNIDIVVQANFEKEYSSAIVKKTLKIAHYPQKRRYYVPNCEFDNPHQRWKNNWVPLVNRMHRMRG